MLVRSVMVGTSKPSRTPSARTACVWRRCSAPDLPANWGYPRGPAP